MKSKLVGRKKEREILQRLFESRDAEFCAVYGRRRVGKTFLIRECFSRHDLYFELTGEKDAGLSDQLLNFVFAFNRKFPKVSIKKVESWRNALQVLSQALAKQSNGRRIVLFFDELPWLASAKSGFLSALDHFWNSWANTQNVLLIVCGSASSWMIGKIIQNRGGLHNRITAKIRLLPFSLLEAEEFLRSRGVSLVRRDILELYMCIGGVPYYLRQVQKGLSVGQVLDRMCIGPDAILGDEFNNLFASLFDDFRGHVEIIRILSTKRKGITRKEILSAAEKQSGGGLTRTLRELEESGFIAKEICYGKTSREAIYRLIDEYSIFYLTWIEKAGAQTDGFWQTLRGSRAWLAWSGFSFEGVCLKHVSQLKTRLGISGVGTTQRGWVFRGENDGAQIDLVIDRADNCINLCEIKYSLQEFTISKAYAADLQRKLILFQQSTKTRKSLFLTMVTTFGCTRNSRYEQSVSSEITMDDLFVHT